MLVVDRDAYEVVLDSQVVNLTATEFRLLSLLEGSPRRVFTRAQLLAAVWEEDDWYRGSDRVLDQTVHAIRKRLGETAKRSRIRTVIGIGYSYDPRRLP